MSGIPGTVGSGSRALWAELAPLLTEARTFGLWPFDDARELAAREIVVGEIYPRACYAVALSAALPARARALGKTKEAVRSAVLEELATAAWRGRMGVQIDARGLKRCRTNEDDFDAMIAAVALLRCVREGLSLTEPAGDVVEGGILGCSAIVPRAIAKAKARRTRNTRGV